jgi:glyoxylase-like metal-dependent hydrolase (beta-lactamase superfamily II)
MQKPIQIPLPIPYPVGPVNCYLFLDPVPTAVDCGLKTDAAWEALTTALATHGLAIADLQRVIITHAHVDHMGLAGKIAAHSPAQIWVADINYGWAVDLPHKWQQRLAFMQSVIQHFGLSAEQQAAILTGMARTPTLWDAVPADRVVTFPLDGILEIGGQPWQTIYTPGHSNTQTCFYQAETRQFLAADMLLAITPTPVIEEPLDGSDERVPGLPQFLDSLALVEALEIEWVYPGHGAPFTDHRALIQRQSARIAERTAQCYSLIEEGHHTFSMLLEAMYGQLPLADRFSALGMLVGYLDLLEADGLIKGRRHEGILSFRVTT